MNSTIPSPSGVRTSVASTALAFAAHLIGALTCATCWAIFGPGLALLFGSSITGLMATMRPFAPLAAAFSAVGLAYSVYQLLRSRRRHKELPYRMAVAFTGLSVIAWAVSAAFIAATLVNG